MVRGSRFDAEKPAVEGDEEVLDDAQRRDEGADVEVEAETAVKVGVSRENEDYLLHHESQQGDVRHKHRQAVDTQDGIPFARHTVTVGRLRECRQHHAETQAVELLVDDHQEHGGENDDEIPRG